MFRWKHVVVAVGALSVVGLTACTPGQSDPFEATLTLGLSLPVTTFDASESNWGIEAPYLQAVYDTVLRAEPDGTIVPGLASDWSYNDSKTVLNLTIRDKVMFSDDTPVTADAVAQNLLRFRDGAGPDRARLGDMISAQALDASTVQLTLARPNPALLGYLTMNAGLVSSPTAFASPDAQTTPVGSGPYILDGGQTVVSSSYRFTANDNYWDPDSRHYEAVVMNVFNDPTALVNAIKGGQVNAASMPDNDDLDQVAAAGFEVVSSELNWAGLILFDRAGMLSEPLGDVRVRQAINFAFDRESLLTAVGKGLGTVTTQVFPTSSAAYSAALDDTYEYDPERAKALLSEAGYGDGFTLEMPSTALVGTAVFTLIQQQLADIGITVEHTDVGNNFLADVVAGKYAASYMMLQQDSDWALIDFQIAPTANFNALGFSDPRINDLIQTIQTSDGAASATAARDLNTIIVEDGWFAPWYRMQTSFATDANTKATAQAGNMVPSLWNILPS